jgi:hypothetical protein
MTRTRLSEAPEGLGSVGLGSYFIFTRAPSSFALRRVARLVTFFRLLVFVNPFALALTQMPLADRRLEV